MRRLVPALLALGLAFPLFAQEPQGLLRVDHYVLVKSTVPAIAGQTTPIYVREVVRPGAALRGTRSGSGVVLFIHGAGTPAEVAYDVPYEDYSWMAHLAYAGLDTFAMDLSGYGRSIRPAPMNDPCNLSLAQQALFVPHVIAAPCKPTYTQQLTTLASDWEEIGAVVDHLRALRRVEKVSLIGWSQGGPRAGGYASQHPEKIDKLVLLAPAYNRMASATPPAKVPADGAAFNTQSRADFDANWDRQIGCADQVDPRSRETVWSEMLASDPVGATWGTGVRRAPQQTTWGWNLAAAAKVTAPALLIAGVHDVQVRPAGVQTLHADLGSKEKVFVDLACASHNALWERNRTLLFKASLEWLTKGTVAEKKEGMLKIGY